MIKLELKWDCIFMVIILVWKEKIFFCFLLFHVVFTTSPNLSNNVNSTKICKQTRMKKSQEKPKTKYKHVESLKMVALALSGVPEKKNKN